VNLQQLALRETLRVGFARLELLNDVAFCAKNRNLRKNLYQNFPIFSSYSFYGQIKESSSAGFQFGL